MQRKENNMHKYITPVYLIKLTIRGNTHRYVKDDRASESAMK